MDRGWKVLLIDLALLAIAVALLVGAAYLYAVSAVPLVPIPGE